MKSMNPDSKTTTSKLGKTAQNQNSHVAMPNLKGKIHVIGKVEHQVHGKVHKLKG